MGDLWAFVVLAADRSSTAAGSALSNRPGSPVTVCPELASSRVYVGSRHRKEGSQVARPAPPGAAGRVLAGRGGSVMGLVAPPRVQMQGAATSAMPTRIVKERQRSRCALGGVTLRASGSYGRLAASRLLRDVGSIASSSLLALTRNSHLPDPPHFHHGLLGRTDDANQAWLEARERGMTQGPKVWAALSRHQGAC